MEVGSVVIAGAGELVEKIKGLLSRAGVMVTVSDYDFSQADLVVVPESMGVEEIFCMAEKQANEGAVFATTSSFGITELAAAISKPEKLVGLNFTFNPFEDKCLVQMVKGLETSEETIEACQNLLGKAGAVAIEIQDSPGLVLDRVMASVINEAATMYVTKVATIEDIDITVRSCLNWPAGPFEIADIIGIDRVLATLEVLSQEIGPQFVPCRLLKQMVAAGRLGKKTGRGFYAYS